MNYPISGFTPSDYETLLKAMLALGYSPVKLGAINPARRDMFLRHDVDLCIERALQIARREAEMGVFSTFYFLISTRFYNLASSRGRQVLSEIAELGHDIGLHFDVTQYDGSIDEIEERAVEECALLERLSGIQTSSLSFHRPARELLNRSGTYAGRRHTYEPAFFSDIAYVSDSNGGWHHGHPTDHAAVADGTAIQLLTHPIWWCAMPATDTVGVVQAFYEERTSGLTDDLMGTVSAYRDYRNKSD